MNKFDFNQAQSGIILGSTGALGCAITKRLESLYPNLKIYKPTRINKKDLLNDTYWEDFTKDIDKVTFVINCIGVLANENGPEKSSRNINLENIQEVFETNTFIPAMCFKHLRNKFDKNHPTLFAHMSAMVGSIEENKLGGWYSYRSSKSALNMLIKCFSLESKIQMPKLITIAQHPGTTLSELTKNYIKNVKYKVKTPDESADILINLWQNLTPDDSGRFLSWDGREIKW